MLTGKRDKSQITKDWVWATDSLPDNVLLNKASEKQNFDEFAKPSSLDEQRDLYMSSLYPDPIPLSQLEPELQKALAKIKPSEQYDVARKFFKRLQKRGLSKYRLVQQLNLSNHDMKQMSANDISKLAAFAYHTHPDIFQEVLSEQPALVKILSIPIVVAIIGIMAAKWLSGYGKG